MSGDVQPRKRKDKRRKKDELGVEEPRGTAAAFGEGDELMHSHHEHGTGGHWCAKIIFFSLLSVLVTLIVLIILENRGLTELEANAVESRYSGVLDGWIEDAPDDDHHDEHTLDLKHHSYEDVHDDGDDEDQHEIESELDEGDHDEEFNDENDDDHIVDDSPDDEEDGDDDDVDHDDKDDNGYEEKDDEYDSDEKNIEEDDDEDNERMEDKKYSYDEQADEDNDDDDENDDDDDEDNDSNEQSDEELRDFNEIDDNKSNELQDDDDDGNIDSTEYQNDRENDEDDDNKDDEDNEAENDDDDDQEVERIEREVLDDEEQNISSENINEEFGENDKEDEDDDEAKEDTNDEDDTPDVDEDIIEPPIVEQIPVPSGKPFKELEDEPSSEKPTDTLAEEEEYEKRQEQIRLEKEESSSQMWLKLVVGGALLLATHAVIRRSAAPDTPDSEDIATREETPSLIDRRMTLLPRETGPLLTPDTNEPVHEIVETLDTVKKAVQSVPIRQQESDEENEDENEVVKKEIIVEQETKDVIDKELYSDEDEEVDDEEIIEEKHSNDVDVAEEKADSEAEEVPDDVEIIDDEQIEEEIEDEEEDEEEISDVDDAELLSRLEAKYGRLPEPERPGQRHKDGGNSIGHVWPGEPSSPYWRKQLDLAEEEIRQRKYATARGRVSRAELAGSLRARYLVALALDHEAEHRRDNELLSRAITAYIQLFKSSELLHDHLLLELATKTLNRIYFRGNYLSAEPVYRLLIQRFPNEISYRNNLTVSLLMANRPNIAAEVLKDTLKLWPNDRIALAHYGFVLKTYNKNLEESVTMFRKALENDTGPACEPRFYYHLGDALLLLGRFAEADEVHRRGAAHGHFLSPVQRSLYNVDRLKGQPWWRVEETPYIKLANALERSWKEILKEGEAARALYEKEKEGLKEKGEWSQLDLFVRGQEILGRCKRAPVTCSIVKAEAGAASCRRGQVKFSLMAAGTHVRPHVGPTNCRLRMHLGLSNTKHTYIRVDRDTRQWQLGKVLLFDDSFEHEVWHNGTGERLVLIVDVWHPELTGDERRKLPAI